MTNRQEQRMIAVVQHVRHILKSGYGLTDEDWERINDALRAPDAGMTRMWCSQGVADACSQCPYTTPRSRLVNGCVWKDGVPQASGQYWNGREWHNVADQIATETDHEVDVANTDTESEHTEFRFGKRVAMTDDGRVCVLCNGCYEFASEDAHGLAFPRRGDNADRDVFICWECARYLFDRLAAQLSSIAYGALFGVRDPIRPTRFLPWLERAVGNVPDDEGGDD